MAQTSATDTPLYRETCKLCVEFGYHFSNFRRNENYVPFLEHLTQEQGFLELERIAQSVMTKIDELKENDKVGNPYLYFYPDIGHVCPSTLRYIRVLSEIQQLFPQGLDRKDVCEIGVGYGGQCRIITSYYRVNCYTLVDLCCVLDLSKKYLSHYEILSPLNFVKANMIENHSYDFVISNYAFSEMIRDVQDEYLNKIILRSRNGYMICNFISPDEFKSYTKEELVEIIPNSKMIEDVYFATHGTYILIW
jgi:hypothetical protein